MKMNKARIKKVELFLEKHNVDYIDIKYELLDHIICDIEAHIQLKGTSFDDSFKEVTEKWEHILEETSSFWLRFLKLKPRVFVEKHTKIIKPILIMVLFLTVLVSGLFYFAVECFTLKLDWLFSNSKRIVIVLFSVTFMLSMILVRYLQVLKYKTVFSFIFKEKLTYINYNYILFLICSNSSNVSSSRLGQILPLCFIIFMIVFTCLSIGICKRHLKIVKQYKKLL